jgi:hypothetical protein
MLKDVSTRISPDCAQKSSSDTDEFVSQTLDSSGHVLVFLDSYRLGVSFALCFEWVKVDFFIFFNTKKLRFWALLCCFSLNQTPMFEWWYAVWEGL